VDNTFNSRILVLDDPPEVKSKVSKVNFLLLVKIPHLTENNSCEIEVGNSCANGNSGFP